MRAARFIILQYSDGRVVSIESAQNTRYPREPPPVSEEEDERQVLEWKRILGITPHFPPKYASNRPSAAPAAAPVAAPPPEMPKAFVPFKIGKPKSKP